MGYIFQADVYCNECGQAICEQQRQAGKAPDDWMDLSSYDSDDYPKPADIEHQESDSPEHCGNCREFMRNPLTSDGYRYVGGALAKTKATRFCELSEVLNQWARWYNFTYWDTGDIEDSAGRYPTPGWYSNEAY